MKLVIIRHGDPNYEIDSLTPTGWKEAELLVPRISAMDVKAFYVSPLGRARDTANETLKRIGREAQVMDWLREFPAVVQKPGRPNSIAWDWLPQDWTQEPRFYDKDKWLEVPVFRDSNTPQLYKKVCDGLDALLASHG